MYSNATYLQHKTNMHGKYMMRLLRESSGKGAIRLHEKVVNYECFEHDVWMGPVQLFALKYTNDKCNWIGYEDKEIWCMRKSSV